MSLFSPSPRNIILFGLTLHIAYLFAVFDTYFHSPIVHVDRSHPVETGKKDGPLADRVVLMVGDGLRADLFFTPEGSPRIPLPEGETVAPYLRSVIEKRGAYGISHTRVPTESRPGHVALIGGLWEDPSAVFKGWKHNPVEFDSLLNQSSTTFSFGSPDILPIFGDRPLHDKLEDDASDGSRRVLMWMYGEDDEDFTSDATKLDLFVLDKLKLLLEQARGDSNLRERLERPGVVFFLHLLGLDTTGHGHGPHTREYINNIRVVDGIVKNVEEELARFYGNDERTAFVFTADHGMSNVGNHGDGHPDNTRTPYVTWGSGIRGPIPSTSTSRKPDETPSEWRLNHLERRDVDQVDLPVLMAALSGTNWPKNGVGILPGDLLDVDEEVKANLLLGNARAIYEQLRTKHDAKSKDRSFFTPYYAIEHGDETFASIHHLIEKREFTRASIAAKDFMATTLSGLEHYDTYDRTRLRIIVGLGYLLFGLSTMAYVRSYVGNATKPAWTRFRSSDVLVAASWLAFLAWNIREGTSWHAVYAFFPSMSLAASLKLLGGSSERPKSKAGGKRKEGTPLDAVWAALQVALACACLIAMAVGYRLRIVWSFGFGVMALVGFVDEKHAGPHMRLAWALSCGLAAVWTVLPVERTESVGLLAVGCAVNIAFNLYCVKESKRRTNWRSAQTVFGMQLASQAALAAYTFVAILGLRSRTPLSMPARTVGWVLLAWNTSLPAWTLYNKPSPHLRLAIIYNALAPVYLLLSHSWEILFLANFAVVLGLWLQMAALSPGSTSLQRTDVKRALQFLFLVHAAFFCTGNVASISSFYLAPVYRLVPVFRPAIMSALLMLKIMIPFAMLGATFAAISANNKLPSFTPMILTLAMSEPICLYFFLTVTTTGSWLEIGSSISHFAIASLLVAYNVFLYILGEWLMRGTVRLKPIL